MKHRGSQKTNENIATLADNKMVFFLDMGSKFLEKGGTLLKEAFVPDMVHLAPKGYGIWAEAIEPIVAKVLVSQKVIRQRIYNTKDY